MTVGAAAVIILVSLIMAGSVIMTVKNLKNGTACGRCSGNCGCCGRGRTIIPKEEENK